jgi:hypothetical protein
MKLYRVIVSGCQIMLISAANEDEANARASDYLVDNSVLRDWIPDCAEEVTDEHDLSDCDICIG